MENIFRFFRRARFIYYEGKYFNRGTVYSVPFDCTAETYIFLNRIYKLIKKMLIFVMFVLKKICVLKICSKLAF